MPFILFLILSVICLNEHLLAGDDASLPVKSEPHQNPQPTQKKEAVKEGKSEEKKDKNEEPTSPHKFSGSVGFFSDYVSRGISQNFRKLSVQGEFKYTHRSGFYIRSVGYNVDGTSNFLNNTCLELDLYLGYKHELFQPSFTYDFGILYYYYPGGQAHVPANTSYDTVEYYLSFVYKGFELKLSQTVTDFFANNSSNPPMNWNKDRPVRPNGHSFGSPYLEANFEWPFYEKWKANFHLAYQGVINYPQLSYIDWFASLTRTFDWFDISLTYVQTNAEKAFYNVPNHAYHPKRVNLGGPAVFAGIVHNF